MREVVQKGRRFKSYGVSIGVKWFSAIYEMDTVDGKDRIKNGPIAIHSPSLVNTHGPLVLHDSEEQAEAAGEDYIKQDFLEQD